MGAYMIITAQINDLAAFLAGYAKITGPLVEKYGGRYILRGRDAKILEGSWGEGATVLISEWPNRAAAERFWQSPEYANARKLRAGLAQVQVLLVDALPISDKEEKPTRQNKGKNS